MILDFQEYLDARYELDCAVDNFEKFVDSVGSIFDLREIARKHEFNTQTKELILSEFSFESFIPNTFTVDTLTSQSFLCGTEGFVDKILDAVKLFFDTIIRAIKKLFGAADGDSSTGKKSLSSGLAQDMKKRCQTINAILEGFIKVGKTELDPAKYDEEYLTITLSDYKHGLQFLIHTVIPVLHECLKPDMDFNKYFSGGSVNDWNDYTGLDVDSIDPPKFVATNDIPMFYQAKSLKDGNWTPQEMVAILGNPSNDIYKVIQARLDHAYTSKEIQTALNKVSAEIKACKEETAAKKKFQECMERYKASLAIFRAGFRTLDTYQMRTCVIAGKLAKCMVKP